MKQSIRYNKSINFAKGGGVNTVEYSELVDRIDGLEFSGDDNDLYLDSDSSFNFGAETESEYKKAIKKIDDISYKGKGWKIYAWYDVSGFDYWMVKQQEQNYIKITISFDEKNIDEEEVSKIQNSLNSAISDASDIADEYNYEPSDYKRGGGMKRNIAQDKNIKALHAGKRTSADGNIYYENRSNRSDVNRTKKFVKGGSMTKEEALEEAKRIGVDFDKDFHAQSFGNELHELAKKTGYRKSVSSSGSTGRAFFYHLQKMNDSKKISTVKDNRMNERTRAVIVRLQKIKADPEFVSPNYVNDIANEIGVSLTSEEVVFISDNFGEKFKDGGSVGDADVLKEKIIAILNKQLPNFYFYVKEYKDYFGDGKNLGIKIAASDYEINNVKGQTPQSVSLALSLSTLELHPQVFGGNGGRVIYREPNKEDPSERYLAMKSVKVPFRTPSKDEKSVLAAIEKFAINYKKTLKENIDTLKYKEYVDYDKLLNDEMKNGGGVGEESNLKITSSEDLEKIAEYMTKAVKKHRWDLKDLIYYFEKDNNFDYKVRVKIWDEMNGYEMPKTHANILKLLQEIVKGNKEMKNGGGVGERFIFGIEYKKSPSSRVFKKSSLTMNGRDTKEMNEAINKNAEALKNQEGWFEVKITKTPILKNGGGVSEENIYKLLSKESINTFIDDSYKQYREYGYNKEEYRNATNEFLINISKTICKNKNYNFEEEGLTHEEKSKRNHEWFNDREKVMSAIFGQELEQYLIERKNKKFANGGSMNAISHNGRYVTIETLAYEKGNPNKNGNLKISITPEGLEEIKEMRENQECDDCIMNHLFDEVRSNSELLYFSDAGEMGFGLTSAPCITDGYYYGDNGDLTDEGNKDAELYYYEPYMVKSFVDDLLNNGYTIFQRAGSNEESSSDKKEEGGSMSSNDFGRNILLDNLVSTLKNGDEVSVDAVTLYLGRKPQYEENIGGINIRKCLLSPTFKSK